MIITPRVTTFSALDFLEKAITRTLLYCIVLHCAAIPPSSIDVPEEIFPMARLSVETEQLLE